jgi:uncharacterized protein (TIGR00251 family)
VSRGPVRRKGDDALVTLRVSPGSKSTSFAGLYGEGALKLFVAAPPVDGKANAETRRYLARLLGLPKSAVEVVGGHSSRDKTILVRGLGAEAVRRSLMGSVEGRA